MKYVSYLQLYKRGERTPVMRYRQREYNEQDIITLSDNMKASFNDTNAMFENVEQRLNYIKGPIFQSIVESGYFYDSSEKMHYVHAEDYEFVFWFEEVEE